jgi:SAM-dependent methyltransferase
MVTTTEVEWAYRMLLGREPESRAVVEAFAKEVRTLEELRWRLLTSPEFLIKFERDRESALAVQGPALPIAVPTRQVQTDASEAELEQLLNRIEQQFSYLGENDPYWSVLACDRYRLANLDQITREEFFLSGRQSVEEMEMTACRNNIELRRQGVCLELGCGVGRTTVWLADAFSHVIAADLSAPHLQLARQAGDRSGKQNITFLQVNSRNAFENLPEFDTFLSIIVLQHNAPPLIAFMLRQILRKLRAGGIAYFQIPTYGLHYEFSLDAYLRDGVPSGSAEMHVLPQPELFRIIEGMGCEPIEIREDGAAGPQMISNRVLVRKKAA